MAKLHKNNLYIFVGFFAAGIFARSLTAVSFPVAIFIFLISFGLFLYGRFFSVGKSGSIIMISLAIFSFSLGIIRFNLADAGKIIPDFENHVGEKIRISGLVDEEKGDGENNSQFVVSVKKNESDNKTISSKGRILLIADLYSSLHYGDEIILEGKIEKPENFQSQGGRTFDYVSYLAKDGIYYEMKNPKIEIVSSGHGGKIQGALYSLKSNFMEKINQAVPAPESALLNGILLGTKQALGKDLKNDFITTGTVHIVALSGYNVTIVAETIMQFFSFLPKIIAGYLGAISIIFFALMTGAGATVIRASIMSIFVIIARGTGRNYDIGRALVIAGLIMLVQNPWILAFDSSFQLSFLATIGLVYLEPRLEKFFLWIPEKLGLRELVTGTLAAEIFVLPFLVYQTGILSLVAFPANLLVLPLIPATMLFGFFAGIASFISGIIALPFSFASYALLHYELSTIRFFSSLPFSSVAIKSFPSILLVLSYTVLFYFIIRRKDDPEKEKAPA